MRPAVFGADIHAPRAICTVFRWIPDRTKILGSNGIHVIAKFADRSSCGRGKYWVQTTIDWSGGRRLCVIALMAACMAIRRHRDPFFRCDALRFSEYWNQHQHGQCSTLQEDGNGQRAAAEASFSSALLRIAFDKAPAQ